MTGTEASRSAQEDCEYPFTAFRDRPACPSCEQQAPVVSGGQWRDGDCVWFCCACDIDWHTQRKLTPSGEESS